MMDKIQLRSTPAPLCPKCCHTLANGGTPRVLSSVVSISDVMMPPTRSHFALLYWQGSSSPDRARANPASPDRARASPASPSRSTRLAIDSGGSPNSCADSCVPNPCWLFERSCMRSRCCLDGCATLPRAGEFLGARELQEEK